MLDLFSVAVIMIRVLALYMLINVTFSLSEGLAFIMLTTESGPKLNLDTGILGLTGMAYVIAPLLLLVYSKKVARVLTKGLENTNLPTDGGQYKNLQAVAFSVLGAYVLTYAIPNLVKIGVIYFVPNSASAYGSLSFPSEPQTKIPVEYLTQTIAQLAVGVWLVAGSRGVVTAIRGGWNSIKAE